MPWIESHSVLRNHKKIREAARLLGIPKAHFVGHLHFLWHAVIELAEDGDISDWSPTDIAFYAEWPVNNSVDNLFTTLCQCGLIDVKTRKNRKNSMITVHDWLDYSWKYLYRKYHTSNPERLEIIRNKYAPLGKPKRKPKGNTQGIP